MRCGSMLARLTAAVLCTHAALVETAAAQPAKRELQSRLMPRLSQVKTWDFVLQGVDDPRLMAEPGDLLVIDYSFDGSEPRELWPHQIEAFKQRADGKRRIVLSYLSVGEAEDYRFYWQADWDVKRPDWFLAETCRWQGNHVVHFWRQDWKDILYRSPFDYLARIQNAGFDGIYLDRVDAYADLARQHPRARAEMIRLVAELAAEARRRRPGFLVVAQNAEELLAERAYRSVLDGVGKEDLFYGIAGDGLRNPRADITSSVAELMRMRRDGKPVLTVEYLSEPDLVARTRAEHARLGFVPTFANRGLQATGSASLAAFPPAPIAGPPGETNPCHGPKPAPRG